MFKGHLELPLAFAAALAGSLCGITISYTLGRTFGLELIHRYGRYLRITEEHVDKAHAWFERVGHWGLTFGYFVPGVRHLTAYAAGMSDLEPQQFALFAYSGGCCGWPLSSASAIFWASAGRRWSSNIDHYLLGISVGAAILAAAYLAVAEAAAGAR